MSVSIAEEEFETPHANTISFTISYFFRGNTELWKGVIWKILELGKVYPGANENHLKPNYLNKENNNYEIYIHC